MARNSDSICLICETFPCSCGKPSRPRPPRKVEPRTKTEEPAPKPSALEAMSQDSLRFMREPITPELPRSELSPEESELVDGIKVAMRILGAKFLDPADERAYHVALSEPDSLRLRLLSWRARNQRES